MRKDITAPEMLFDRRVVERNIQKGVVTREEYERWVQGQRDVSSQSERVAAHLGAEPRHSTLPPARGADSALDDDDGEEDDDEEG
ncbi:MAG: hypothetical protein HY909_04480 [Deltaproteobacteria bacterium]|nr:hypothetical protein [Deltaproteobacteria bacterium]